MQLQNDVPYVMVFFFTADTFSFWQKLDCFLRLLRTFAGVLPCPPGKKISHYARHFKGKHGKLYIVGKVNKCRFRKKIIARFLFIPPTKIAKNARENDYASFNHGGVKDHASFNQINELIGYHNRVSQFGREIWPAHFLDIVKAKYVGYSWNL